VPTLRVSALHLRSTTIVTRLTERDDVIKSLLREAPRLGLALGPAPRSCIGPRAEVLRWALHLLGPALAAPFNFIQATPQLVLSALIGNFANKVACFGRIVSHPIAKSHVKPWSVREHDATWVRLFLPFVFEQLRLI